MHMETGEYYEYILSIFRSRIITFIIVSVFLTIILSVFFKHEKDRDVRLLFLSVIVLFIVCAIIFILPYGLDLLYKDFIVYEGDYEVVELYWVKSDGIYAEMQVGDSRIKKMSLDACSPDPSVGKNTGKLVYSKFTKILFYWDVQG